MGWRETMVAGNRHTHTPEGFLNGDERFYNDRKFIPEGIMALLDDKLMDWVMVLAICKL